MVLLQTLLRANITRFVLSLLVVFVSFAALSVHLSRGKWRDRTLLWFGLFAGLYGLRSLSYNAITQTVLNLPPSFWSYLASAINNTIVTPALLFFEEFYGKGWKSAFRWAIWAQAAWGVIALAADIYTGRPGASQDPSNLMLVVVPLVLIIGYWKGYRPRQSEGVAIIFGGCAIFLLTIVADHLRNINVVPWRFSIEPVGFLTNLACLGYVAVRRFVGNEQQLAAIEEEMKSARRIQTSILPRGVPILNGFKIAVRYLPMTAVAGDFYDFLPAAEGGAGILVADVTGHGVPAALIASMVKVAVTSQADHAGDPAHVIGAVNQVMCRQSTGQFTTAGYLYLDGGAARYAAAGHPPLLVWRKLSQSVEELRENGLLMGIRASEKYINSEVALQPGDRLLLYTDGIPEAANPAGDFFGDDRLKEFIAAHDGLSAEVFADTLVTRINAWAGSGSRATQADDITLVVVDVQG